MTQKRYVRQVKFTEETGYPRQLPEGVPRIRCAVCNRLVQSVEWSHEMYSRQTRITVRCHGDTETMLLDTMALSYTQLEELKNQEGIAFATRKIAS